MTSERKFIDEVNEPRVVHPGAGDRSHRHQYREATEVSLESAQSLKNNILVPEYLPSDYALLRVNIAAEALIVMLVYGNRANGHQQHGHLQIIQGGALSPEGIQVKQGQADVVDLQSGNNARVIRGGWAPTDPHDESSDLLWSSEVATTLFFERSEGLIVLRGEPASAWPTIELQNVAISLRPA